MLQASIPPPTVRREPLLSFIIVAKDDPQLESTLRGVSAQAEALDQDWEIVVVDASRGRLDQIRPAHPRVRWFDYEQPAGRGVTIPHQRNVGVGHSRGEVIVFIDASCVPDPGWLPALIGPLQSEGESLAAGSYRSAGARGIRDEASHFVGQRRYLDEAPTLNLAVARQVFELIGGFDESFDYGSDVDFTWRAVDAGCRIRYVPEAVVAHDWGTPRAELRRSFRYGQARYRLYAKHPRRRRDAWRREPEVIAYPLFLLISPLALVSPWVAALLVIPVVKNIGHRPVLTVVHHLVYGTGILAGAAERTRLLKASST
jgi:Glycosyl transferase family 2